MKLSRLVPILVVSGVLVSIGCDGQGSNDDDNSSRDGNTLTARTILTSSSLSGNAPATLAPLGKSLLSDALLTPDNVSGDILSFLFATASEVDEGLVVFGDNRPDIAPTSATLFPFDFAVGMAITANILLKPGFVGGASEHCVALFGYADFDVTLANGNQHIVRIAMADIDGMQRGDKLLDMGGVFQWYDLDTMSFTSTRPVNPAVIEPIRDFTDPIRPNLVFYPLNVFLDSPVTLDATVLAASSGVDAVVTFPMAGAITLIGQTSSNVTTDVLLTSFSLTQVVEGYGNSGLQASATVTPVP